MKFKFLINGYRLNQKNYHKISILLLNQRIEKFNVTLDRQTSFPNENLFLMSTPTHSKALSYLLRHGAQKEKVNIDDNGYILYDDVIAWFKNKKHSLNYADIQEIITSDKKN